MVRSDPRAYPVTAVALLALWTLATLLWWGLAFPPLREAPPPWLMRLQEVCFGTDAAGSPAPYGWGALLLGPLGILGTLLAGWWQEIRAATAQLLPTWGGRGLLAGLAAALLAQGGWMGWSAYQNAQVPAWPLSGPVGELPPDYPRLNQPLPPFRLVDQKGAVRTPVTLQGRVTVLTFAFGHCTSLCPATLASAVTAMNEVRPADAGLVVVTLDAWRDTPSSLQQLVEKWSLPPDSVLLSGRPLDVEALLDALNVARSRNERTGDIDHVALVYILNRRGDIAYAFSNPPAAWIAEALRRTAQGS